MTQLDVLNEIADLLRTRQQPNDVMGIEGAAAYLDIKTTFLRELISLRKIPAAYLKGRGRRGRVVLRRVDLDAYVSSRLVRTEEDAMRLNDGRRKAA